MIIEWLAICQFYLLKSLAMRAKKDMNILLGGGGGNESTSETKRDTKSKHKIIYTVK